MERSVHALPDSQQDMDCWLRSCRIFADWPAERVQELARVSRMHRYRRRTQLTGDDSQRREILVVSGSIEVAATNAAGDKYIQSMLLPGQVTKLVHVLEDAPALFAYHAREDSEIVHIPGKALRRMLDADPALWQNIALIMLQRYCLSIELRHGDALGPLRRRMAITLMNLAQRYGDGELGAFGTELHLSQTELAGMLCVSRQTVGKELARLKDERILGYSAGYRLITLLDIPALMRIATAR